MVAGATALNVGAGPARAGPGRRGRYLLPPCWSPVREPDLPVRRSARWRPWSLLGLALVLGGPARCRSRSTPSSTARAPGPSRCRSGSTKAPRPASATSRPSCRSRTSRRAGGRSRRPTTGADGDHLDPCVQAVLVTGGARIGPGRDRRDRRPVPRRGLPAGRDRRRHHLPGHRTGRSHQGPRPPSPTPRSPRSSAAIRSAGTWRRSRREEGRPISDMVTFEVSTSVAGGPATTVEPDPRPTSRRCRSACPPWRSSRRRP